MSFKDRIKRQTCIHWPRTGTDGYGRPTFGTPSELDCRWSGKNEKFTSATGEELVSRAQVFVDGVAVGDVLMLGSLDGSVDQSNPLENEGAWEVKSYTSAPNLRNTVTYYKAYL